VLKDPDVMLNRPRLLLRNGREYHFVARAGDGSAL
jgi:hypothetical protein